MRRLLRGLLALPLCVAACNATSDAGFPDATSGAAGSTSAAGKGGAGAPASTGGTAPGGAPHSGGTTSTTGGTTTSTGGEVSPSGGFAGGGQPSTVGGKSNPPGGGGGAGTPPAPGGTAGTSDPGDGGDGGGNAAGASGGPDSPPALTSFRLAVIGSSTSAGEGASSSSKGWVSLLADALEDVVTTSFTCNNLSVGGYSSNDLSPGSRSNGSIDDAIDRDPDLIVVALAGSNDLSSGTSKSTFLSRLEAMRKAGQEAQIPVFFLTTAPKDLSNDEQEALEDWAHAIKDDFGSCWTPSSSDHSPCVIDVFEPLASSSLGVRSEFGAGDGIHLNDAGHAEIFRLARAVIEPYVCSLTSCR
jgi:lysophospholipase L1-like esterase